MNKNDIKQSVLTADVGCSSEVHETALPNGVSRGNVEGELPVQPALPTFGTWIIFLYSKAEFLGCKISFNCETNAPDRKSVDITQRFFQFSIPDLPDVTRAFRKTLVGRGGDGKKSPGVVLPCAGKKQLRLINWNLCFSSVLNRLWKYGGDLGERICSCLSKVFKRAL